MARMNGIQRKLHTNRHNKYLERLEHQLQRELDLVLQQEEAMWFQKSQSQWIKDGDRNTRYYHVKTIARRRRNKILILKNDQNDWVENEEDLKNMVNGYYQSLFARPDNNIQWRQTKYSYPNIGEEEYASLKENINNIEVKNALFAMAPWKAPGPDGFPADFYQHGWRDVGSSICDFVKSAWHNPVSVATVNLTDICLIPKVNRPEFVSQFRPISLCNVSYKIITKVMVNRLKQIVPNVVSPFQTGFVPGRNITKNILIAQEMLHSMTKMKSKLGFFVIKVDLSKAYDRLSWEFIHQVLLEIKIPDDMINVIMHCVTSIKSDVLWNGNRSDFFSPQCGIRQGDPMSPYLLLCMDKISHLIAEQLSLAGRITLAKSVIQAIPIYPMMFMPMPKSCLDEIEKIQRAFIWGDTGDKRKARMVGWETITKPKSSGGLGF
jgi:hypothetical protein